MNCPMCGGLVEVHTGDEGTSSYVALLPDIIHGIERQPGMPATFKVFVNGEVQGERRGEVAASWLLAQELVAFLKASNQ